MQKQLVVHPLTTIGELIYLVFYQGETFVSYWLLQSYCHSMKEWLILSKAFQLCAFCCQYVRRSFCKTLRQLNMRSRFGLSFRQLSLYQCHFQIDSTFCFFLDNTLLVRNLNCCE